VFVARAATWPQPNPVEVDACAWIGWDEFVREAEADQADCYSWWCKNQLDALKGHPLIEAYARGLAGPAATGR
jgi:isopentenyldiphosphate isomerase